MKVRLLPALFFALLNPSLFAQKTLHIEHGCAYKTSVTEAEIYTFEPSEEAERIVAEICKAVGLSPNFEVRGASVENALATTIGNQRVILYSTLFLRKFNEDAQTRWAAYSVLAHEIGHHLNNHNFAEENPKILKQMELEADRFSGSALNLLGATLDEAKAGLETFALQGEQPNHPSAKARKEALATGWIQQQERRDKTNPGQVRTSSEPDADKDGVPDKTDNCPQEFGRLLTAGCPDADEDGVRDSEDACRYVPGLAQFKGCPDTDGDGLPDHEDKCPKQAGLPADKGCPPPDRDGDTVIDRVDKCPDQFGLARFQGCPDKDGDGVPDLADKDAKFMKKHAVGLSQGGNYEYGSISTAQGTLNIQVYYTYFWRSVVGLASVGVDEYALFVGGLSGGYRFMQRPAKFNAYGFAGLAIVADEPALETGVLCNIKRGGLRLSIVSVTYLGWNLGMHYRF